MKSIRSAGFTLLAAAISAIALFSFAANVLFGPKSTLAIKLIDTYKHIVSYVPLDGIAKAALRLIERLASINLQLDPDWKLLVIPALLYFTTDSKVFFSRREYLAGFSSILIGALMALALAMSTSVGSDSSIPISVIAAVASIVIYDSLMSALDPALTRSDYSWREQFRYYTLRFPLVDAAIGAACIAVAIRYPGKAESLVLIFIYLLLLTLRDFAVAGTESLFQKGRSWRERLSKMLSMGSFQLGLRVRPSGFLGGASPCQSP